MQGHHSTPIRQVYERFRKDGYLFLGDICLQLGISTSAYRRMEAAGKIPKVPRRKGIGGMMVRLFRAEEVERLKLGLHHRARAGNS
jgi:predicted DNA-binding transcriptional regulator AlpA